MKLKVIDMEMGTEKYVSLAEAQDWKWGDPGMMRMINHRHVFSFEKLTEMAGFYEQKGVAELTVYEAPSFMLLGGG